MPKARIKIASTDINKVNQTCKFIKDIADKTGVPIHGPIPLPTKVKRYTVLRSPHINKDSREQFEIRIHSRMIDIVSATSETIDSLMKLHLAPEVEVEIRSMDK